VPSPRGEFHLPAVVGTRVGTEQITDGPTITVEVSKGLVRTDTRFAGVR
jgi:phosphohistidine swiveling domain-containing protein